MFTRRALLAGVAPGAALVVAGCTTAQQTNFALQWTTFIDQVTAIVARGCSTLGSLQGFIPTANTIEAIVAALYPAADPIIAAINAGSTAVLATANALCAAIPPNPPPALLRKLRSAVRGVTKPVYINTVVVNGKPVPVLGYGS